MQCGATMWGAIGLNSLNGSILSGILSGILTDGCIKPIGPTFCEHPPVIIGTRLIKIQLQEGVRRLVNCEWMTPIYFLTPIYFVITDEETSVLLLLDFG